MKRNIYEICDATYDNFQRSVNDLQLGFLDCNISFTVGFNSVVVRLDAGAVIALSGDLYLWGACEEITLTGRGYFLAKINATSKAFQIDAYSVTPTFDSTCREWRDSSGNRVIAIVYVNEAMVVPITRLSIVTKYLTSADQEIS